MVELVCLYCGKSFRPTSKEQRYCRKSCRTLASRRRRFAELKEMKASGELDGIGKIWCECGRRKRKDDLCCAMCKTMPTGVGPGSYSDATGVVPIYVCIICGHEGMGAGGCRKCGNRLGRVEVRPGGTTWRTMRI